MKIRTPNEAYVKAAEQLTKDQKDRLLSRMGSKLTRRFEDKKLSMIEVLAVQLETEDAELADWREKMNEIKEKEKSKKKS